MKGLKMRLFFLTMMLLSLILVHAAEPWFQRNEAFTGGGPDEKLQIPLTRPFPVQSGSVTMKFRLNSEFTQGSATLFDLLGTPVWYDRFILRVNPKGGGNYDLDFTATETNRQRYGGYATIRQQKLVPGQWHHIAATWDNVNSSASNAELKLYLDGVLVAETANLELQMLNTAKHFLIGGAHKPFEPGPSKIVSISDFALWDGALPSTAIYALTGTKPRSIAAYSEAAVYKAPTALAPFTVRPDGTFAPFPTQVEMSWSGDKLHISWNAVCEGLPASKFKTRDDSVWYDDSMELYFSPDGKELVHFIGNSLGTVFDERSLDGGKNYDSSWNGNWKYTVETAAGSWSGKLEIDLRANGLPAIKNGDIWFFNVFRNGFTPQVESSWNPVGLGSIREADKLGRIHFHDQGRSINIAGFPELYQGRNTIEYTVSGAGEELKFELAMQRENQEWRSSRVLPPRMSGSQAVEVSLPHSGSHTGEMRLTDAKGKLILVKPFSAEVALPLGITLKPDFPADCLNVLIDFSRIDSPVDGGLLKLVSDNKVLDEIKFDRTRKQQLKVALNDLPENDYIVQVELYDSTGQALARRQEKFHRYIRPAAIDSQAGRKTYWGDLTPLTVEGQTVNSWNRSYRFADTIFPQSMRAGGEDLLKEAPVFRYRIGKQSFMLKNAQLLLKEKTDEKVILSVNAGNSDLNVAGTVELEYDGAVIYQLDIAPKRVGLHDFSLNMALDPRWAQVIFEGTEMTFTEAGNVIKGPGWKRSMPFQSKFGIGNTDRGLFWFCESNENWLPYEREDVINIEHTGQSVNVTFQITALNTPVKPLKLSCGFITTPVKPVKFKLADHQSVFYWPGGPFFSSDPQDYSRFSIRDAHKLGAKVIVVFEWWPLQYGGSQPANPEDLKRLVNEAHELGMKVIVYRSHLASPNEPSQAFFGQKWLTYPMIGYTKYNGFARNDMSGFTRCPHAPEYIDWFVAVNRKLLLDYGLDGFYYDIAVTPCASGAHGCGFAAGGKSFQQKTITVGMDPVNTENPYANRRPSWPILSERELWKRMYNMVKEIRGEEGLINVHLSWTTEFMYCGFADTAAHSEYAACRWDGKVLPSLELYRLFFSKQFMGLPGDYLCYTVEQQSLLGMALLHREWFRIRTYGDQVAFQSDNYLKPQKLWKILEEFGVDAAEWHPYYEKSGIIKIDPPGQVYCSYWQNGDRLLAVVANVTGEARSVQLSVPGYRQAAARWDTAPAGGNGNWQMNLKAKEFTLIEFSK